MADSEFITRADVERVRAEVQGIAGDYDAVESPDLVTHLYAGMYRVADSVLDHLLHPEINDQNLLMVLGRVTCWSAPSRG